MAESMVAAAWRVSRTWPLLLGILLLLNVGVYAWITYRLSPEVTGLERNYIEAQAAVRQGPQGQEKALSPREQFERAAEDLRTFRAAIPEKKEFTGLIKEVFSLAGAAGLSIERIGYTPAYDEGRNLLRYALSFSVDGEYGQIKKFIASLEQSPRIIAIEEISLSGGDRQEGATVGLNLRLATYFRSAEV